MTTKTRNIVIIVARLLVTFALLLSALLLAVDGGKASPSSSLPARLSSLDAPGGWKLSGRVRQDQGLGREPFGCEST